ncbi:hypothetical protein EG347_12625 [Chryseobacterium sp. G0186]|uniref:hypothetical protein n=1 Tax=Chryseobacterium sp. G0186 TaxID=2487064 RepID=UPI000F507C33|nr:hypothetical protein [Chryseobacterium sp. G0186]AZA78295.1 hypothetical protein EG347_12625 [Chryseobacterium sp. G0186]
MKKTHLVAAFMLGFSITFSQVGILTDNPEKELDVNGELKIRKINELNALSPNEKILIANDADGVVSKIALNKFYNPSSINLSTYSANRQSTLNLINLGLSFGTWQTIDYTIADKTIGDATLFSDTDHSYKVPSTGVYSIGFYFRYGTGVQTTLLSGPKVGILKRTGSLYSVIDQRSFTGINLALANITFSETSISSIYRLNQGDLIYFAVDPGLISLGLLSTSKSSFYIYKISD